VGPAAVVKGQSAGRHGGVDVGGLTARHFCNGATVDGRHAGESVSFDGINSLSADEGAAIYLNGGCACVPIDGEWRVHGQKDTSTEVPNNWLDLLYVLSPKFKNTGCEARSKRYSALSVVLEFNE
jgi:hypothetical protein